MHPLQGLAGGGSRETPAQCPSPRRLSVCPAPFSVKLSFNRSLGPEQLETWAQRGPQASVPVGTSEGLFLEGQFRIPGLHSNAQPGMAPTKGSELGDPHQVVEQERTEVSRTMD